MTKISTPKLAICLSATAFALLLQRPVLAEQTSPAPDAAEPPAKQAAAAPGTPDQYPAQAALAVMEAQREARIADLDKRYQELREQATSHGFEMPPAPPWTDGPQWLSFDEMQQRMTAQGVKLEPPTPGATPATRSMPTPATGSLTNAEDQKGIFDTIEQMTPEEQQACFAMSRWHARRMPRWAPPVYSPQRMPQYPPGYIPRYGQPYRGMMRPQ